MLQRFDQLRHPGLRFAEDQRRALAGKNVGAQRFTLDRFAIGLHHGNGKRLELAGHVELGQRARPLAHDGEQLEQEDPQFGVGRILAYRVLQSGKRRWKVSITNELLCVHSKLPHRAGGGVKNSVVR